MTLLLGPACNDNGGGGAGGNDLSINILPFMQFYTTRKTLHCNSCKL